MAKINVVSRTGNYPVIIEKGLINELNQILAPYQRGQQWVILTHPAIWTLYGEQLSETLGKTGIDPVVIRVPEGEASKALSQTEQIISFMIDHHCDRSTWLMAFGGGVVGDLGGFTASVFMRGISYIQIPTTLLAMVDSSVGGKTAVNTPHGKNLIGTFFPPKIVLTDPGFLTSLPPRQICSASAEILKTGAISDAGFFEEFSRQLSDYLRDPASVDFSDAIISTCSFKAKIVSQDEQETGLRQILNFGHTAGHALETFYGHQYLTHGESVAYGMLCAGYISNRFGQQAGLKKNLPPEEWTVLRNAIRRLPLPPLKNLKTDAVISIMKRDKKNRRGRGNFVLLEALGKPVISQQVSDEFIIISMEQL